MKTTSEVTLLIGATIETMAHVLLIFATFGMWAIVAAVAIPLCWVARSKSAKGNKGWAIYGIVHGVLFGWITMLGHILSLIAITQD